MTKWRDTTRRSRGEKEKIPTTFSLNLSPRIRITVTCGHIHYRGLWVMHCDAAGINTRQLSAKCLEDAKIDALAIVRDHFQRCLDVVVSHMETATYQDRNDDSANVD